MRRRWTGVAWLAVVAWATGGCSIDRSGLGLSPADAGPDADRAEAGPAEAGPDGGRDAGRDAGPRDTGPDARDMGALCPDGRPALDEICDGVDDDCNGIIDDGECQAVIAGGPFTMGCDFDTGRNALCTDSFQNGQPAHAVTLSRYAIDRVEVTVEAWQRCAGEGGCAAVDTSGRRPLQPMAGVTWDQARAFCQWRGADLPTEAQWERAARGSAGNNYPWGLSPVSCELANHSGCPDGDTRDVGATPAGATPDTQIQDLAGNVGEWVLDWFSPAYYGTPDAATDPLGPDEPGSFPAARVVRGGSYVDPDPPNSVRSAHRGATEPTVASPATGFRCARPVP